MGELYDILKASGLRGGAGGGSGFTPTQEQLDAMNSGIDSEKVAQIETNKTNILSLNGDVELAQDGILNPVGDWFQQTRENRIWFCKSFKIGSVAKIINQDYDVATAYQNGAVISTDAWVKNAKTTELRPYIAIRKSDKSDISGLTPQDIANIINVATTTQLYDSTEKNNKKVRATQFIHFSVDDAVFWENFTDTTYTSIFDNDILAFFRSLHDTYGFCVTFNCFCSDNGADISSVVNAYQNEFKENSDWLKFAFHAENSSSNYSTDAVSAIKASYDKFVSAIYALTGTTDCIDRVTRLGFFTGSLNNVLAIRDTDCGIVGLLTADDTRLSYYLQSDDNTYVSSHAKLVDYDNRITFVKSQLRLESISSGYDFLNSPDTGNTTRYMEMFTHEYEINTAMKTKITSLCEWCLSHGYTFGFAEQWFGI